MSTIGRIRNKLYREIIQGPLKKLELRMNLMGHEKECYTCKTTFSRFEEGSSRHCFYCRSTDRERHLLMFFDKLGLWDEIKGGEVLDFAPETYLSQKIEQSAPAKYIKADLSPEVYSYINDVIKMDATAIAYGDSTFDFFMANHILEHIPDYKKALSEAYRVLKPNGVAILQTPAHEALNNNFEDDGIDTDALRTIYYGQWDHVRMFSEARLLQSIKDAGFIVELYRHEDLFSVEDADHYGVWGKEYLLKATKPAG